MKIKKYSKATRISKMISLLALGLGAVPTTVFSVADGASSSARPITYISQPNQHKDPNYEFLIKERQRQQLDVSIQEAYVPRPDYSTYLISYAHGHEVFYRNQAVLANSAINKGIDFVFNYRFQHLDPDFKARHAKILDAKYGAGQFIWKPYIIMKALMQAPENSRILYTDSGFIIIKPLTELFAYLDQKDILLLRYHNPEIEPLLTVVNDIVWQKLGLNSADYAQAEHIWSNFLLLKNTEFTRAFIKKWQNYCEDHELIDYNLLGERQANNPKFLYHRCDEALLSVLYASADPEIKANIEVVDSLVGHRDLLYWSHRHPGDENISAFEMGW